jgi:RND family efflux transporter MFP subunit
MRRVDVRCRAVIGCAALAFACGDKQKAAAPAPPRPIQVLTLAPTPLRTTGEYLGSLMSRESVNVLPQVAGYVREIHVVPGQRVAAGAPLVEIDARDENAALTSASAQARSAVAQRDLAHQSLSRAEALHKQGLAPTQEVDQRRADLAAAEAAVRAATAAVSQKRVALSNRTISAAIPGVLGDVNVRIGDYVTATTPLTSIAQAEALELTAAVSAARARGLTIGAPVEVLGEDGSVLVATRVSYVAPEADPQTQLVEVKATFENTARLRPRELVRARLVFSTDQALQVPALAVQRQAGEAFAFVVVEKDGKLVVERRLIKVGALHERGYVVAGGLAKGDRIAVSALHALKDGMAVVIGDQPASPRSAGATAPGDRSGTAARPKQGS